MASHPLSWLLRLSALCYLSMLLAGQHHGVKKCDIVCTKMTSEIPVKLLASHRRNQASCNKHAIILTTIKNRTFCADPEAKWVQEAMEYLDRKVHHPVSTHSGGKFEMQIGATSALAARGMDRSAISEPRATGESSSQEAQKGSTSPELPTEAAGSWGNRFPTSKAPDAGPSAGSERTELSNAAAVTTATSWPSSASQPGSDLWAEGKASEATSTQAPFSQTLHSQVPSTEAPTISHTAPEDNTGPESQPVWTNGQDPMSENPLGPRETGPISAHTDAFMGPGSVPPVSVVPVSSKEAPSREPVASGSWAPKAEDPQRLDTLITPAPDSQAATRRQAVGLLAFLGLLFCLGVAMFAYQSLQGCSRNVAGDLVEGLRYVPRSCGSNSYVLVPV